MSEENLKAFINALKGDSSLIEKVRNANSHAAIAKIATDEGFAITEDHVIAKHDISAEELEAVSGAGNSLTGEDRPMNVWTNGACRKIKHANVAGHCCPFTMKC